MPSKFFLNYRALSLFYISLFTLTASLCMWPVSLKWTSLYDFIWEIFVIIPTKAQVEEVYPEIPFTKGRVMFWKDFLGETLTFDLWPESLNLSECLWQQDKWLDRQLKNKTYMVLAVAVVKTRNHFSWISKEKTINNPVYELCIQL